MNRTTLWRAQNSGGHVRTPGLDQDPLLPILRDQAEAAAG